MLLTRRLFWKITLGVATLVLVMGLLMVVARSLTPYVSRYHNEIQELTSELLGYRVEIGEINVSWRWYRPVINFSQVQIFNEDESGSLATVDNLSLVIKPLGSLWHWQLQPNAFFLSGARINVAYPNDGDLQTVITDFLQSKDDIDNNDAANFNESLGVLLGQKNIQIHDLTVHWVGEGSDELPIVDLDLSIRNKRDVHYIDGSVLLRQAMTSSLHFSGSFEGELEKAEIYLDFNRLVLDQWLKGNQWQGVELVKGIGDAQFWVRIENKQINRVHGQFKLDNVELIPSDKQQNINLDYLSGRLDWKQDNAGWRLIGKDFNLSLNSVIWPENKFSYEYRVVDDDISQRFYTPYLHWKSLWPLLTAGDWFEGDLKRELIALKPVGEFRQVYARQMSDSTDASFNQWYLKTNFYQLGWQSWQQFPAIDGLSGSLAINPKQGKLSLNSKDFTLSLEEVFPKPINLTAMEGELAWKYDGEGWLVTGKELGLHNDTLALLGNFSLNLADSASLPDVNLEAKFKVDDISQVHNYLPSNLPGEIFDPELVDWLNHVAPGNGQGSGTIVFRGNLADFPFDNHEGVFIVDADLAQLDFNYFEGWPIINNATAKLVFNKRDLHAEIYSGELMGVAIEAVIDVPDIGKGLETLAITGQAIGDAHYGVDYIRSSPLIDELEIFNQMDIDGDMQLSLDIAVPLYDKKLLPHVQGDINLQNAHLEFLQWPLEASEIEGKLKFSEVGILSSDFTSNLFNGPAIIKLKTITGEGNDKYTQIKVDGETGIKDLSQQFDVQLSDYLKGHLSYSALLRIQDTPDSANEITIHSDLKGVDINLPDPIRKPAEQSKDFTLVAHFGPDQDTQVQFNIEKDWSVNLLLVNSQQGYDIGAGEVRFGSSKALLPKQAIIRVVGTLPYLSLSQWSPYLVDVESKIAPKGKEVASEAKLDLVDLRIKEVELFGHRYNNLDFTLERTDPGWQVKLKGDDVIGDIQIAEEIQAHLQYLNISANETKDNKASENKSSLSTLKPSDVPPLFVVIDDLHYDDSPVGRFAIVTVPSDSNLIVNRLNLQSNDFNLNAHGIWGADDTGKIQTNLTGMLEMQDIADVLKAFDMDSTLTSRNGTIDFNFAWLGSPSDFALAQLVGDLDFKFYYGEVTELDPATEAKLGAGKILSLLSLSTLPRRLQLDFSDLSGSGYNYDSFQGSFNIAESIAQTEDTTLDGPVAYLSLSGIVDLGAGDYNLNLQITPHVTSSLPVIATILGGPIVGAATWAADRVVDYGFREINPYNFRITGTWDQPDFEEVIIANDE